MTLTFYSPGMLFLQSGQCVTVSQLHLHQGRLMVLAHLLNLRPRFWQLQISHTVVITHTHNHRGVTIGNTHTPALAVWPVAPPAQFFVVPAGSRSRPCAAPSAAPPVLPAPSDAEPAIPAAQPENDAPVPPSPAAIAPSVQHWKLKHSVEI